MIEYFATREKLTAVKRKCRDISERAKELYSFLLDDSLLPSSGVAAYTPMLAFPSGVGDPTAQRAIAYHRNRNELKEQCNDLFDRITEAEAEALGLKEKIVKFEPVISELSQTEYKIAEQIFCYGRTSHQCGVSLNYKKSSIKRIRKRIRDKLSKYDLNA